MPPHRLGHVISAQVSYLAIVLVYFTLQRLPAASWKIKARLPFVIYIVLFSLRLSDETHTSLQKLSFYSYLSCLDNFWDGDTDAFGRISCDGGEMKAEL